MCIRDRAGAHVALLDLDVGGAEALAQEIRAAGGTALAVARDIASEAAVARAAEQVNAAFGPAQVLVNNAGFLRAGGLADVSLDDWSRVLAVNLTGYLLCARAFGQGCLLYTSWPPGTGSRPWCCGTWSR